jgi:hypothetical protein
MYTVIMPERVTKSIFLLKMIPVFFFIWYCHRDIDTKYDKTRVTACVNFHRYQRKFL